ncbi:hypothetical protein KDX38_25470 [Pseudomonas sp. CDFA 602]|nr:MULTISPECIES: hypothetical protein [Pseudomonas]MCD5996950.1 hypothetical protein [Pseudomonas californiensis]MCD6002535.1 hypothetical protein [Pseudomonas californiensis]RMQ26950.1 hypothetical protein ALQ08_200273 [Pseudomonas syringae pv. delphinii]
MTEEEMRLALFGMGGSPARKAAQQSQQTTASDQPPKATARRKNAKNFVPKLIVTLRVGNEFEGATELFTHQAHTLSKLQAELDAMKEARRKYKYIELVSVK